MKAFSLRTLALIILLAFYSCKKSNAGPTPAKPHATTWTLNGVSYIGDSSYSIIGGQGIPIWGEGDVGSLDSGEVDQIDLYFDNPHPANGTYTVINGDDITNGLTHPNSTQVGIVVTTAHGNAQRPGGSYLYSTGTTGDTVNISVSGNTITASFANISVTENNQPIEKVSGTIVAKEQ
jgi:hypothetical protein